MTRVVTEIADIARLVEMLAGEDHLDRLVNLRDNSLKLSLDRLQRTLASRGNGGTMRRLIGSGDIEALRTYLFGSGYSIDDAHQTVHIGSGGLYALQRDFLVLRDSRFRLQTELHGLVEQVDTIRTSLIASARQHGDTLERLAAEKLQSAGGRMLLFTGLSTALFLALAWIIFRAARRQVDTFHLLRHRNESILRSTDEGILGLDPEGRITFLNPAVKRMTGWDKVDLLGKTPHATILHSQPDGSAYPAEECPVSAACRDGAVHRASDEFFRRKDGSSFPVEFAGNPIRDERDRVVGAVVNFRDIHERRRAEKELQQQLAELERFNRLSVGRELRMIELKREVNGLVGELGRPERYHTGESESVKRPGA